MRRVTEGQPAPRIFSTMRCVPSITTILDRKNVYAETIWDGIHVHPAWFVCGSRWRAKSVPSWSRTVCRWPARQMVPILSVTLLLRLKMACASRRAHLLAARSLWIVPWRTLQSFAGASLGVAVRLASRTRRKWFVCLTWQGLRPVFLLTSTSLTRNAICLAAFSRATDPELKSTKMGRISTSPETSRAGWHPTYWFLLEGTRAPDGIKKAMDHCSWPWFTSVDQFRVGVDFDASTFACGSISWNRIARL